MVRIILRKKEPVVKEVTRQYVKKFHEELNECLDAFAKSRGFIFKHGGVRFSSSDVTGRVVFILKAKEMVVRRKTEVYSSGCKFNVGDLCSGPWGPDVYELMEFTRRGKALIRRIRDNKKFRCAPSALVEPKVKK